MLNLIKKSMLTGIGLALIAKHEVEDMDKQLVNKGKLSETEGTKFMEDLQKKYDETQKRLEEKVQRMVKDFMKKYKKNKVILQTNAMPLRERCVIGLKSLC